MASYSKTITNLFGGVSQAPATQRDESQFAELVNTLGTYGRRLGRRPGSRHIAAVPGGVFLHQFGDYYITVALDGSVHVFDAAGTAQTVNNFLTGSYLGDGTTLRAITVGDRTYILNTTVKVAKDPASWFTAYPTAHVTVATGDYETAYTIQVGGGTYTHTTPAATAAGAKAAIQTTTIAAALMALICPTTNPNANGISVTRYNSVLTIKKTTLPIDFTLQVTDGLGGSGLLLAKDTVKAPEDLPPIGEVGTVLKVVGQAGTDVDDYWVQLDTSTALIFGGDTWSEAREPASLYGLDVTTLPVNVWRDPATGFFEVRTCAWTPRNVGGDANNPYPSFVGQTINDLFVLSGRLGFISGSRVTLSEAGKFFNFFRTTTTQVLSSDPIDIDGAISGARDFVHALNWRGAVYLFSDTAQFTLTGGRDGLTVESISVAQASAYRCDTSVRPIVVGQRIFFVVLENGTPHVMDYHLKRYVEDYEAIDLCTNIPTYIQGTPLLMVADESLGLLFVSTSSAVYVYAFRDTDDGRVQSAWSTWQLPGAVIWGMTIVDRTLRVVRTYADDDAALEELLMNGVEVGTQTIGDYDTFDGSDIFNGTAVFTGGSTVALSVSSEHVALDRRVNGADLPYSYNAGINQSAWTLPYNHPMDGSAGILAGYDVTTGEPVPLAQVAPNKVVTLGNYTGHTVLIGALFTTELVLSTLHERDRNGNVDDRGRLQLRYMTLDVADTRECDVWVEMAGRASTGATLRRKVPTSGRFTFPVQGRNTDTVISILVNGPGCFFLTGYSWEGTAHTRVPRR